MWPVELLEDDGGGVIKADRVPPEGKIIIDGNLDEETWKRPPIDKTFITMVPTFGAEMSEKTQVWAAYDRGSIYFAFKCFDSQPGKIKTSVVQRDKIGTDDQVAVWLDSLATQQSSYEFYVNPNGIQMDGINSTIGKYDRTPDFVWESAAKLTNDGYQVEIRLPLTSIRYQVNKKNQTTMRVMFFRQVTRQGAAGTWPEATPGKTDFNCMSNIVYQGLKKDELKMELLPSFTYAGSAERTTANTWEKSSETDFGIGIKYGITSSITAEATVNPDFSHVESDIFQVEVNQRYPLFYSEKRPFFMESQDVLDFTIVHDAMASVLERGMMVSPIHTRRIVDPGWAVKLSGSSGRTNFAFLAANDRSPGWSWAEGGNPFAGKSALFGIVRAKYNFSEDNSLGVLYTGRRFNAPGERNDVGGIDLKYRLSNHLRASLSYLHSATQKAEGLPTEQGGGMNAILQYLSHRGIFMASYERYDNDFHMESAFQNRVGISRWWFGFGPYFNVDWKLLPWLKRFIPYIHYSHLHDLGTQLNDISRVFGAYMNFSPMGDLYLEYRVEDEAWKGKRFDKNYFIILGQIQLYKSLYLNTSIYWGGQIYYDSDEPFLGDDLTVQVGATLEPALRLKVGIDYLHSDFKNKETRQNVYSVNIYNLHTTYQFNKYFFIRGILRYDDLREKLLTDLLASFTLIPGTVVHLGYGSLYQRNQWRDNRWLPGQGDLLQMRRGLFFKASYLWRIK
jgi:hypothetical protein